ncbi:GGDEF domain-containing protein [Leptothrix discophora]|uniref:Diguanylate cyclase n=1 Tax=Leptothrix discophora TaxID=89 RepID=A0ABT9G294_LEPDI|nr:sensor domain-containing diguanylate cyclase [Leptothrix discophora]MDP4300604.1 diguanylate cyclase [Leptothrix discophora]
MTELPPELDVSMLSDRLLAMLDVAGVMVSLKVVDGDTLRYRWANAAWLGYLGVDAGQLIGRDDHAVLPPADAAAVQAADRRALGVHAVAVEQHRFERPGQRHDIQTWRSEWVGVVGERLLLTVWRLDAKAALELQLDQALQQIERQQGQMDRLREDGAGDRPDAVFRRDHFEATLQREAALSQREGREFALVLLAVDRLEDILQDHGDAAAQRVGSTLLGLMRANTRAMDVLSQLGPERYAILFSGIGLSTAHARVEQLRRACAAELLVQDGRSYRFEISAGVASFPHSATSLDGLSQASIRALNEARQRGGNRVVPASISLAASRAAPASPSRA